MGKQTQRPIGIDQAADLFVHGLSLPSLTICAANLQLGNLSQPDVSFSKPLAAFFIRGSLCPVYPLNNTR